MFLINKYKPSVYLNFFLKDNFNNINNIKFVHKNYYNYTFKHKNIIIRDFLYIYYLILMHNPFSSFLYKDCIKNLFRFKFYCLLL